MKKQSLIISIVIILVGLLSFGIFYGINNDSETQVLESSNLTVTPTVGQTINSINSTSCTEITKSTTEGPYYVSGTKELSDGNLNYSNLPGTTMKVKGFVYAGIDNTKPISNAKIEFWQTDNNGKYHPQGNGSTDKYNLEEIALRGYILTKSDGSYEFATIYPGYYEGRARHIHAKASADGYETVITQMILQPKSGDGVTYSTDSIAQTLPSCHVLSFDNSETPTATFDFRLK